MTEQPTKFYLARKFNLDVYDWKGCYIELDALSYHELQKWEKEGLDKTDPAASKKVFKFLEDRFISGKVLDSEKNIVDLKKEDIRYLPFDIIVGLNNWLFSGSIDENLA